MQDEPSVVWSGIGRLEDSLREDRRYLRAAPLGPRQKIWLQRSIDRDAEKIKKLRALRREHKKKASHQ